ncbi:2-C-methyl-D-erythritol 4-phosphate cytidylyltransferase [uncultured Cetobacterium sp.]|uniref:2-C-methyl-D-erythritol 4-phosphate cytidylyltransferase n=1 Tax=uncultured Cetobacterium sp. TaxID=527638 RepID=UPI0026381149|nr:2-C-methyl-D-erythritol 4-phosphate cytidylyltransferase [uncultured Cetobacterium sp.]
MYSGDTEVKNVTLILAAAGVGKRMGLDYPKQFLKIDGKALYIKSLEVAEKSIFVKEIIIVTGKDFIESIKNECKEHKFKKVIKVIEGGSERQHSIKKALDLCSEDSIISVQDGVRPFLKERYFKESIEILNKNKDIAGVVVGVPVKDTIKKINSLGVVESTPKRDELFAIHTPQTFRGDILKRAYKKAEEDIYLGTDDSSLVERIGEEIKLLLGDYDNIKITTVEDLKYL